MCSPVQVSDLVFKKEQIMKHHRYDLILHITISKVTLAHSQKEAQGGWNRDHLTESICLMQGWCTDLCPCKWGNRRVQKKKIFRCLRTAWGQDVTNGWADMITSPFLICNITTSWTDMLLEKQEESEFISLKLTNPRCELCTLRNSLLRSTIWLNYHLIL